MNFLEGKHFILFYSSVKTFFDAIKRYFVPRHIESTLIECLMTVVKVMTRQPLAHHIFCLFTTIRSYLYIKTLWTLKRYLLSLYFWFCLPVQTAF